MKPQQTEEQEIVLLLDRPAVMPPKTQPVSVFCFYAVLLLLGAAASLGCLFTAFPIELNLFPIVAAAMVCAVLCALQFLLPPKWGWPLSAAMALCWGLLLWHHFDDLVEAFKRVVNVISAAYSEKLNFELPIFLYLDFAFPERERWLATLLAAMALFPLIWFLSWLLVKHKATLGAFALTGLFLLVPMSFSILPSSWALGAMLTFWMFLLLCAPTLEKRRLLAEERGRYQAAGVGFVRASSLLLMAVPALCLVLAFLLCPPEKYQRPQAINKARDAVAGNLNLPPIFRNGSGSGGSGTYVDLASLGERVYTGETVLRVRREWNGETPSDPPKKEFLKSFVGSVYTGSTWETLSAEQNREAAAQLKDRSSLSLPSAITTALPNEQDGQPQDYALSVESLDKDPGHVYAPYTLKYGLPLPAGTGLVSDSFLRSTWLFGTKNYTYFSQTLPKSDYFPSYRERLANGGFALLLEGAWAQDGKEENPNLGKLPAFAEDMMNQETLDLTNCWEDYSQFVYDTYTQLPDDLRDFLLDYRLERNIAAFRVVQEQKEDATAKYIRSVQRALSLECTYTLNPPRLPQGEDFVEYFLSTSHQGYCVHFATAAVALFRSAGIPARYAEGYVAPLNSDGSWSSVPDKNAHAWAEIWVGGVGWIPVEVTPAGPDAPAAYETALAPESAAAPSPTPSPTPVPETLNGVSPSPTPSQAMPTPTHAPGAMTQDRDQTKNKKGGPPWGWIIGVPAGLLLTAFVLCASRWLRLTVRKRKFRQADRNKAGLAVYAHILRLHKQCLPVIINVSIEPPEELEQIALKARFSTHMLSEAELAQLLDHAAATQRRMLDTFSKYRRFYCKYILALF